MDFCSTSVVVVGLTLGDFFMITVITDNLLLNQHGSATDKLNIPGFW